MSITDELRKEARGFGSFVYTSPRADCLTAIADRIDAEHQKQMAERRRSCVFYDAERNYCKVHDEGDMAELGYVRLPVDADGEYIRIGDVMAYADNTKPMEVVALVPPAVFLTEDGPRFADMCRHYHEPTVEDVLTEFGIDWEHESDCEDRAALLKEYAAKLRLSEEEDA